MNKSAARTTLLERLADHYRRALDLGGSAERDFGELLDRYSISRQEFATIRTMVCTPDTYTSTESYTSDRIPQLY